MNNKEYFNMPSEKIAHIMVALIALISATTLIVILKWLPLKLNCSILLKINLNASILLKKIQDETKLIFWSTGKTAKEIGSDCRQNKNNII